MRVALLAQEAGQGQAWGGIATYTWSAARGLTELGHDVTVLVAGREDERRLADGTRVIATPAAAVVPGRLRARSPLAANQVDAAVAARRAVRAIAAEVDVVESPEWLAEGLLTFLSPRLRRRLLGVTHLHGGVRGFRAWDPTWQGGPTRAAAALESLCCSASRLVTACSRIAGADPGGRPLVRPAVHTFPMPVDPEGWGARPLADGVPELLVAGSLLERKRPDVAVAAAALLVRRGHRLTLRYVGKDLSGGAATARLLALGEAAGVPTRVDPPVGSDALGEAYAEARVLIVPSSYETFGLTAAEAMLCARPVVVTDRCGVADTVRGTAAGAVVAGGSAGLAARLADALEPYVADAAAARHAGDAGRALVLERHAPAASAAARVALWETAR